MIDSRSHAWLRPRDARAEIFADAEERYGAFIRERVNPSTYGRDRLGTPLSRELLRELITLGLANRHLPVELGGGGASMQEWGLLLEWLGKTCNDMSLVTYLGYRAGICMTAHQALKASYIAAEKQRWLKEEYLEPFITGDRFASFAYTDTGDPFAFRSMVRKVDGGYIVNALKPMVSGAMFADWVILFAANEQRDLMVFVVELDDPGVATSPVDTMGVRSLGVARLQLEDVFLPEERLLIGADGLSFGQQMYNSRRLTLGAVAVGVMQRLFEECVANLSQRIRYRLPVTEMQAVQARFGTMYVAIESARAMLYEGLDRYTRGEHDLLWDEGITAAKYFIGQQAAYLCQQATYVLGGAGYDRTQPFERVMRDIQMVIHGAGTQAILEVDLGIHAIHNVQRSLSRARRHALANEHRTSVRSAREETSGAAASTGRSNMSKILEFDEFASRLVEAGYLIPDMARRRSDVLRILQPRSGEQALDIGCGPGFVAADLAAAVGPSGKVCAIDASKSMLGLARKRCAEQPWVEVKEGDATGIPCPDETFDIALSSQVYEYVSDVDKAIAELHRVLRPGGRALVLDTDWPSIVWNSSDPDRMKRVLAAWDEHLVHPSLPRTLASRLRRAGLLVRRYDVYTIFNPEFDGSTYSAFIMKAIAMFVPGRQGVTSEIAAAWSQDLMNRAREGDYFFNLNQYIFVAEKPRRS